MDAPRLGRRPVAPALPLKDGDPVVVVGGGPAGAFFAIHLLRNARQVGRRLDVSVVERRRAGAESEGSSECEGCTRCAGGISPRLNRLLDEAGLSIPADVVQEEIRRIWVHSRWKNIPLRVPRDARMCSVFRGTLPGRGQRNPRGFDGFLLAEAVQEGARLVPGEVTGIEPAAGGLLAVRVARAGGETTLLPAAFVAVATGVNGRKGCSASGGDGLGPSLHALMPRYAPPTLRRALIFELSVGRDYVRRHLHEEAHFIEYGSRRVPLEHVALVPKGGIVTVTVLGKFVDDADLPRDGKRLIAEFLALRHLQRILPGADRAPVACSCHPWMSVAPAREPHADRIALIGDAVGARLYKDGLLSACITAEELAHAVSSRGVDNASLAGGYGPVVRWLAADNRYGRSVFGLARFAFRTPSASRVLYQAFASEMKAQDADERPVGQVLWKIASGVADYREVLRDLARWRFARSLLVGGGLVTLRNWLTEMILGLDWSNCERYPTIVPLERRDDIKRSIGESLGLLLDRTPDLERMAALKVRAPVPAVYEALAAFGDERSGLLDMRLVDVLRASGEPNEPGCVVRYRIRPEAASATLTLVKRVPDRAVLFDAEAAFMERGRLAFEVQPARDGNTRLSVYACFDFPRGATLPSRVAWRAFRALFPDWLHDVVWNHALCRIKAIVEKTAETEKGSDPVSRKGV